MADHPTITTDDLWLPGDVLGGALLRLSERPRCVCPPRVHEHGRCACGALQQPSRVDCTRPEVRDRIVRVLAAGERCACPGRREAYTVPDWGIPGPAPKCPDCNGTGYTRPRHDLLHVTAAEVRGDIGPTVAAGILWCSVLRVGAGLGPVTRINGLEVRQRRHPTAGDVAALLTDSGILLPHPDGPRLLETR